MQITSQLKFTDIPVEKPNYNLNFYKDTYTLVYRENFTEHLVATSMRYSPAFYFYRGDNIIGVSLWYYGEYTEQECNLLSNFINDSTVVYDIGANIGVHTLAFAKKAKHVYAFEPNNKNYELLGINTVHEKNVSLFNTAVSDDIGMCMIEDFVLGEEGNFGECKISDKGQIIGMTTIDQLVKDKEIEVPHVIKIDVEGHEWQVIQGMEKTIKENLPIIFYEAMHCDLASIYDHLNGLAYTLYWFPCSNYNPTNYRGNKENIFGNGGVLNILAIPFHINVKTDLPEVISRDDSWEKVVQRLTQNAKSD